MTRTLVVTNDFPPRAGGIQSFIMEQLNHLDPNSIVVHGTTQAGDRRSDEQLPYPVIRDPSRLLLPTPAVARRVQATAREFGCDQLWVPAAAPLGLLAGGLRRHGIQRSVATTHGHEIWWSTLPGARAAMHRIGELNDHVTYLTRYTRDRIAPALSDHAAGAMRQLVPGVDAEQFRPGIGRAEIRERYHLTDRQVVVCISRLVPRKGQDTLIQALPLLRRRFPDAALLLVGEGPDRARLGALAAEHGVADQVVFTGRIDGAELSKHLAAAEVFAMPCRTRNHGFDVEGLGICYLEAAAAGLPVIAGNSGGAPDAVRHQETGFVVDGSTPHPTAERITWLLEHPEQAQQMGARGREWVLRDWRPQDQAALLRRYLAGEN